MLHHMQVLSFATVSIHRFQRLVWSDTGAEVKRKVKMFVFGEENELCISIKACGSHSANSRVGIFQHVSISICFLFDLLRWRFLITLQYKKFQRSDMYKGRLRFYSDNPFNKALISPLLYLVHRFPI